MQQLAILKDTIYFMCISVSLLKRNEKYFIVILWRHTVKQSARLCLGFSDAQWIASPTADTINKTSEVTAGKSQSFSAYDLSSYCMLNAAIPLHPPWLLWPPVNLYARKENSITQEQILAHTCPKKGYYTVYHILLFINILHNYTLCI